MYSFFRTLLQPYPLLFVAMAVALAMVWRKKKAGDGERGAGGGNTVGSGQWAVGSGKKTGGGGKAEGRGKAVGSGQRAVGSGKKTGGGGKAEGRGKAVGSGQRAVGSGKKTGGGGKAEGRGWLWLLTAAIVVLTAVNMPAVANLALGSLEWRCPPQKVRPGDVEAIVVLCGYVHANNDLSGEMELGPDTLCRCLHAARLYRQGRPCPVIVSGGKGTGAEGPTMAETMRDFLLTQGVAGHDIVLEDRALSGYENAVETAKVMAQRGIGKIMLVTSAAHMPRAAGCFRGQGVDMVASPCDYEAERFRFAARNFWPNAEAGRKFQMAMREWMGLGWYWMRGRI